MVAGRDAASVSAGVELNASPTLPANVWPEVMMGAPLPSAMLKAATELVPPDPVAVSDMGKEPDVVGVPVTSPVAELRVAHVGRETGAHDVTGRLSVSLAVYFFEKGTPTLPVAFCPAGMIGTPSEIVKVTGVTALVPPEPEATKFAVIVPLVVGVPVMAPLGALNTSPTGRPVMAHELAGRSSGSSRLGSGEVNASPTLPVKVCPARILGAPNPIPIIAVVAALVPPDPVAVSVIVVPAIS